MISGSSFNLGNQYKGKQDIFIKLKLNYAINTTLIKYAYT